MRRPSGRLAIPRVHVPRRAAVGAVVSLSFLVPGWFWVRDSSLVGIREVQITGLSGPQAAQVRQVLTDAAERMSTLHVQPARLVEAVRGFPIVAGVRVQPHLPHELDVEITQHVAVGALVRGDRRIAVAGDGTILEGTLTKGLPVVPVSSAPGGRRLVERDALRMVALLGAAPAILRDRVSRVGTGSHGLIAQLSAGPDLYFGGSGRLSAKWAAATSVLADPDARGAAYLDLRVPERPAAGGFGSASGATAPADTQPQVQSPQ